MDLFDYKVNFLKKKTEKSLLNNKLFQNIDKMLVIAVYYCYFFNVNYRRIELFLDNST